jgi:hypothetical protein
MSRDYSPSAAPGCLAPHAWLEDGRSLYDLFGKGFTLLVFDNPEANDITTARVEAKKTGTPFEVVYLPIPELALLYEASRALIRPDQFVAWRGNTWPDNGLLSIATGRMGRVQNQKDTEPPPL